MCYPLKIKTIIIIIIIIINKLLNLGAYHTNFPNLKHPRAPSQNCKKKNPCSF